MLTNSRDGIFKNPYHVDIHESEALYWTMTPTNNLINYNPPVDNEEPTPDDPGDLGIHPGTEGVISFNVIPKVDSVNLGFDFEIIGYQLVTDDNNTPENTDDDTTTMTKLSDLADDDGDTAQNLLNGHILLFEHRTETTSGTTTTVTYSDPILSNQDMQRIFSRPFSGKNTPTQVDIYWVWPNTLSTLVDSRSFNGITTAPFSSGASYTAIVENVEGYPHYYLKGAASTDNIDAVTDIAAHYDTYGDMYDQGDNEIGMRVHYVLIKLSVSEGSAAAVENNGEEEPGCGLPRKTKKNCRAKCK